MEVFRYYEQVGAVFSEKQRMALDNIRRLLQDAENSRWLLAELYSGDVKTKKARAITAQAQQLKSSFEPIWRKSAQHLEESARQLNEIDFRQFAEPMKKIAHFLDADFNRQSKCTVYLLPNPMRSWAAGHVMNKTQFMFVRPSGNGSPTEINDTVSTIAHEYVHIIQFASSTSRDVLKSSYEQYLGSRKSAPSGFTWKDMYIEALIYCFASKRIRGYLSEEIYKKPRVRLDEVRDRFQELVKQDEHTVYHIMNWAALNALPDVELYLERGQKIDARIADKLSEVFLDST